MTHHDFNWVSALRIQASFDFYHYLNTRPLLHEFYQLFYHQLIIKKTDLWILKNTFTQEDENNKTLQYYEKYLHVK